MRYCALLLALLPAFVYPSEATIIVLSQPYVEFNEVPVWYFKQIDTNSTQVLANNVDFTLPMSAQQVSYTFPVGLFISGYLFNKLDGALQTNYVFIRKDRVESVRRLSKGRARITLKTVLNGRPAEIVQLAHLNKEQ
ncbi:MAG: hypothetical protein ACRCY4_03910 [Brevinema sp.]